MTTRLNIYNEKNVCLGYVSYTFIDSYVIHFDDLRIDKQRLTDTIRVEGEDGLWFLDTDSSNYYESGNFCVFDYGNINLTKKPEFVWVLLKGSSLRGEREQNVCGGKNQRIEGVFEKFDHGWSEFKKLTDDYTEQYKCESNLRNPFAKTYLIGPKESDEGDWEFDYGFTYAGGGWFALKKYELK